MYRFSRIDQTDKIIIRGLFYRIFGQNATSMTKDERDNFEQHTETSQ